MRAILFPALALVATIGGAALAGEGASTTNLNVRSGAGTANPRVGGLAPGDVVQIIRCDADAWCQIAGAGVEGWVASRFLTAGPSYPPIDPRCRWELDITLADPQFRGICPAGVEPPAPPPPTGDLACLYNAENFGGTRTCLEPGEYRTLPAELDNSIASVQISGEARVRLCTDADLGGTCMDWLESALVLDRRLDKQASSVLVYLGYLPPPPPPPPVVHAEGTLSLALNGRADLDQGGTGPAGADLWWRPIEGTQRMLVPVNGAQLSLGDGSDRALHACRAESFDETPLDMTELAPGAVICLKTNLGRVGRVQVAGRTDAALTLDFVTWARDQ